jgi:hypothetical protein
MGNAMATANASHGGAGDSAPSESGLEGAAGCRTISLSPVAFAKRCKVSVLVLILSKWRLGCGSLPHYIFKPRRLCQMMVSV